MTKLKLNQLGTRQIFLLNFGDADADGSDDDGHDDADGDDDDTSRLPTCNQNNNRGIFYSTLRDVPTMIQELVCKKSL